MKFDELLLCLAHARSKFDHDCDPEVFITIPAESGSVHYSTEIEVDGVYVSDDEDQPPHLEYITIQGGKERER